MNNKDGSIKPKLIIIELLIVLLIVLGYVIFYNHIYSQLGVEIDDSKNIEYGTKKFDLKEFVASSNGKIKEVLGKIDTSIVGEQKVDIVVEKYNISKVVTVPISVVDIDAPVIQLKDTDITITQNDSYDLLDNIVSVIDDVDGDITYQMKEIVNEEMDINYYTISSDFDSSRVGTYQVEVRAVDRSNNVSTQTFTINVEAPVVTYRQIIYASAGSNSSANNIVNTAYSLIGSPYVHGGTSPSGFDCSGFVQYVYAQNGIQITRSSNTQMYDGVGVNYSDAEPGDILIWGYNNGTVTHSALYIGNDEMIHAANPSTGVIRSNVSAWTRGSDVQVLYVRRVVS